MTDDATLGGYLARHARPPAFEGSDGAAYSVDLFIEEQPAADGLYEGAILFVRWSTAGDAPVGHLETEYLARAATPAAVQDALHQLTLHELKTLLDQLIAAHRASADWA